MPFTSGLDKIPRRYYGWLVLTCILMTLFFIIFGFYANHKAVKAPYIPYLVHPHQVSLWINEGRNLLLLELSQYEGQEPALKQSLAVGNLKRDDLNLQARAFLQSLPEPWPWIICYSIEPNRELIRAFLAELHLMKAEHIYALSGGPEKWAEFGLIKVSDESQMPPPPQN